MEMESNAKDHGSYILGDIYALYLTSSNGQGLA